MLVLAQSDVRFYDALSSSSSWTFDFKLFKKGDDEPIGMASSPSLRRSGVLHLNLEEGDYVVHVSTAIILKYLWHVY